MDALFSQNDHVVELRKVKNEITGGYINDATVTAIIYDADGQEIQGQVWPLTLSYVAASNGTYRGIVESDVTVDVGDVLSLEITVTATGGLNAFFKIPLLVKDRREK